MANAVTRYAPEQLPVLHGRVQPPQLQQTVAADERTEAFRAEPPRTEVRYSSRYGRSSDIPSINAATVTVQQLTEETRPALLTRRGPLLAGYGAYAATARQTDPDRSRPGQNLDVSV